jgi:hypothetical protein
VHRIGQGVARRLDGIAVSVTAPHHAGESQHDYRTKEIHNYVNQTIQLASRTNIPLNKGDIQAAWKRVEQVVYADAAVAAEWSAFLTNIAR